VTLALSKPELFTDKWIYIDEPSVKVGRIENFRTWSPELVPDQRLSSLGLEYFRFEGDGVWTMLDEDRSDMHSDITSIPVGIPQQGLKNDEVGRQYLVSRLRVLAQPLNCLAHRHQSIRSNLPIFGTTPMFAVARRVSQRRP
jgi:hypothetical protein